MCRAEVDRARALAAAVALAAALGSGRADAATPTATAGAREAAMADAMLELLDGARIAEGLPPLRRHPTLTATAEGHARDMVANDYRSHIGLDGRGAVQRVVDAGYGEGRSGLRVGENFAGGDEAADAFAWLMSDAPHRANMLHAVYRDVGVGAAETPWGFIWVLDFGAYAGVLNDPLPPTTPSLPAPVPTRTATQTLAGRATPPSRSQTSTSTASATRHATKSAETATPSWRPPVPTFAMPSQEPTATATPIDAAPPRPPAPPALPEDARRLAQALLAIAALAVLAAVRALATRER